MNKYEILITKDSASTTKMDAETWENYREEAKNYATKCNQLCLISQEAYRRGDGSTAKEYSNEAKDYKKLSDAANEVASNAIFHKYNENQPPNVIDLHGLYVKEAIQRLDNHIAWVIRKSVLNLDVIVGQGLHSENGPKIKPNVIEFAKSRRIPFSVNERNPGCVIFHLRQYVNLSSIKRKPANFEEVIDKKKKRNNKFEVVIDKKRNRKNKYKVVIDIDQKRKNNVGNIETRSAYPLLSTPTKRAAHQASTQMDSTNTSKDLECTNIKKKLEKQSDVSDSEIPMVNNENGNSHNLPSKPIKPTKNATKTAHSGTIISKNEKNNKFCWKSQNVAMLKLLFSCVTTVKFFFYATSS